MEQLLQDIDELLAHLEDYEHGEIGRRITELRGRIQQLQKHNVIESVCPSCKSIPGTTCCHSWHYDNNNRWKQTVL